MDPSLSKRVGRLEVGYDEEADVLYVSVGKPRAAVTDETGEGLLVRKDPATGEIVGVTVLDYEQRFNRLPDRARLVAMGLPQDVTSSLLHRTAA
ncbi:MAG: DUF2283 domain-containing protein [Candidatus Binataceae bacterium]